MSEELKAARADLQMLKHDLELTLKLKVPKLLEAAQRYQTLSGTSIKEFDVSVSVLRYRSTRPTPDELDFVFKEAEVTIIFGETI